MVVGAVKVCSPTVNCSTPVLGVYAAALGTYELVNGFPIGLIPKISFSVYPLPGLFNTTFLTPPSTTTISPVAPTPVPILLNNGMLVYVPSAYPVPAVSPSGVSLTGLRLVLTCTVIVVAVSAVIAKVAPNASSDGLG